MTAPTGPERRRVGALLLSVVLVSSGVARAVPAPRYPPWGFDLAGADLASKPGDGFFRYANGRWLDATPIPPDKRSVSVTVDIIEATQRHVRAVLEAAAEATPEHQPLTGRGKVGAFYRAYMDVDRIDAAGLTPLAADLGRIREARTRSGIARLMGSANETLQGTWFGARIEVDHRSPKTYGVEIGQTALGLPDRGYYLDPKLAATKAKYQDYVASLLAAAGWAQPEIAAERVVALESAVAAASWTSAQQRDLSIGARAVDVSRLGELAPGFPWHDYLAGARLGSTRRVVLKEDTAIPKIAAVFAATPVDTLRAWLAFTLVDHAAPYLSAPILTRFFDFREHTLSGVTSPPARWQRGVRAVSGGDYAVGDRYDRFGDMGWAVGQLYVAAYFSPSAKAEIEAMVGDVRATYRKRVAAAEWMSAPTKAEALRKLDSYRVKVGYPDDHRDYSTLVIRDDDLLGDVERAAAADWAHERAKLAGGVTGREWGMTPQTVDAYHGLWLHEIVFPAGILQPPIFDPAADPAVNFGAIGATIAHEITHGLDDQGRRVDADGRLRDWWTPRDAEVFKTRSDRLADQFSTYEPLPGIHTDGHLVLGEALADLVGLSVALDAYHASLSAPPPTLDGFTGDQRFFFGSAQYWRGKARPETIRRFLSDPHPSREFRADGTVRNIDAWYATFDVKPGDRLYLAPADRVRIW